MGVCVYGSLLYTHTNEDKIPQIPQTHNKPPEKKKKKKSSPSREDAGTKPAQLPRPRVGVHWGGPGVSRRGCGRSFPDPAAPAAGAEPAGSATWCLVEMQILLGGIWESWLRGASADSLICTLALK